MFFYFISNKLWLLFNMSFSYLTWQVINYKFYQNKSLIMFILSLLLISVIL